MQFFLDKAAPAANFYFMEATEMNLNRRNFAALTVASCFLPFLRWRWQPDQPICVYETNESWEDLPNDWLHFGPAAAPTCSVNIRAMRRIELECINGVLIATVWFQDYFKPDEFERRVVDDLSRFLGEIADYRRRVDAGRG